MFLEPGHSLFHEITSLQILDLMSSKGSHSETSIFPYYCTIQRLCASGYDTGICLPQCASVVIRYLFFSDKEKRQKCSEETQGKAYPKISCKVTLLSSCGSRSVTLCFSTVHASDKSFSLFINDRVTALNNSLKESSFHK